MEHFVFHNYLTENSVWTGLRRSDQPHFFKQIKSR
nr:MAG TPA: hypothetical protein [Caudoviricetes sp.]